MDAAWAARPGFSVIPGVSKVLSQGLLFRTHVPTSPSDKSLLWLLVPRRQGLYGYAAEVTEGEKQDPYEGLDGSTSDVKWS
ncbi:hypothetical protein NDU88_000945 [Pleurodeles waltl]|uniref:Uncharacterized protein n=1 Tax=Pleurodeles waltl TaxID=8319 RepID=A0AAV7U4Y5_PLEWA|nr:hypothetical protein NDU88_000945 [Pleurodeles waltl]